MVRLMRGLDDAPYDLLLAYYYPKQILRPTPTPEFEFYSVFSRGSTPVNGSLSENGVDGYFDHPGSETDPAKDMAVTEKLVALRRDFDPVSFMQCVGAAKPMLRDNAVPGSFKHFLLLLLERDRDFGGMQHHMQTWLAEKFPKKQFMSATGGRMSASMWMMDKALLTDELEVLRKLVKPLRKGKMGSSLWIDIGYEIHEDSVNALMKAWKVIEEFKHDITARTEVEEDVEGVEGETIPLPAHALPPLDGGETHNDLVENIPAPVGTQRMVSMSMRMIRLDACREALARKVSRSREPATFGEYYERYQRGRPELPTTIHDRDLGIHFLPSPPPLPSVEDIPKMFHDAQYQDSPETVLEIMSDIARWLSRTRCTEAVDLFCDVARMFSHTEPPSNIPDVRYGILRTLSDVVFVPDCAQTPPTRPYWKTGRGELSTNAEFGRDARESYKAMLSTLRARMTDEDPAAPEGGHGHRLTSLAQVRKHALSVLEEGPSEGGSQRATVTDGKSGSKDEAPIEPKENEKPALSDEKEELKKLLEKTPFFLPEDSDSSSSGDESDPGTDEKNISEATFEELVMRGAPPSRSILGTSAP